MKVSFINNNDGRTLIMKIGDFSTEVMFMPEKCIDHRGLALYLFSKQNNVKLLDYEDEDGEIDRGYDYMLNPIYVKQAIKNFRNRL